jgi:hypothetical protein
MLLVCQSIWPPSLYDKENHAIFATRSPTAIRDIRPFRLRRKQIPDTSRSGTWTTRRTRSRLLFGLPFLAIGEGSLRSERQTPLCSRQDRVGPKSNVRFGQKRTCAPRTVMSALPPKADMCIALAHVCFGPIADIGKLFDHLIGKCDHIGRNC